MALQTTIKYSEEELVALLHTKSEGAFAYLYQNYAGALLSTIKEIVKNETIAADVLQEVFVKVWRQIDKYDATKARLFTWLLQIARNTSIDMLRSKQFNNEQKNQELPDAVYELEQPGLLVDGLGLRKHVHELPPDIRQVVQLGYLEGYTQQELADMLGIPLGTIKTRMRNGVLLLRKRMTEG
ncbi:MAG: sigma-70 family RNA polymerase sigma factor [Bacteroidetes bacterium]|nr:MAG: sigma-70 family RNA polymerase sigma factor [Bacteroidota bacterium]TAE64674.1 MAG: sigma-70 family RNA polymerase sigma factor [Bacteroidota bacterium]TAF92472.1 MAG: sigma-70 family RNA polymerase sigma factor [Bacteroidota bacterium]